LAPGWSRVLSRRGRSQRGRGARSRAQSFNGNVTGVAASVLNVDGPAAPRRSRAAPIPPGRIWAPS
jgi:hypothetical protein